MLPDNAKNLEEYIPGIGRYSAGAISSIAYGEHVPVVSQTAHLHQVVGSENRHYFMVDSLMGMFTVFSAASSPSTLTPKLKVPSTFSGRQRRRWLVVSLFPLLTTFNPSETIHSVGKKSGVLQHAGDVNQALIELGSTVCKVRDPDCKSCPLQSWCSAYKISATSEKYTVYLDLTPFFSFSDRI